MSERVQDMLARLKRMSERRAQWDSHWRRISRRHA